MARQRIRKTKTKYRKSKTTSKVRKDSKGRLHCSRCGAYLSR